MASSTTLMLSLKAILISTGVASIAMLIKFSVPVMLNFAVYGVPEIWSGLLSWLKPPYLYVVINGIIITIAASSRFHHHNLDDNHDNNTQSEPLVRTTSAAQQPSDLPRELPTPPAFGIIEPPVVDISPVIINGTAVVSEKDEDEKEEFVISRSSWAPPQRMDSLENMTDYGFPVTEKPLVSSRFSHRKPIKSSPEGGRALKVVKPKRHDTLESTWKTITDGRHVPLTRHLRKSDTVENHGRHIHLSSQDPASPAQLMHKSETFKDHTNYTSPAAAVAPSSPGSAKLRKEASPSQDELNRRVEAFIRKFNEDMRMQRQESLNQYNEMLKRGAH